MADTEIGRVSTRTPAARRHERVAAGTGQPGAPVGSGVLETANVEPDM